MIEKKLHIENKWLNKKLKKQEFVYKSLSLELQSQQEVISNFNEEKLSLSNKVTLLEQKKLLVS